VIELNFNSRGLAPSLRKIFQKDPLIFPEKVLGVTLWDKQKEIFRAIYENERVAVPACNHAGKTHTAACLTLAFLFTYYPSKVITTSAFKEQVKDALWSEIRTRVRYSRIPLMEEKHVTTMGINLGPDWYAVGLRPQDSSQEAFQGRHSPNILLILDESSGVGENIWESAEGLMTSANCHWLALGNPFDPLSPFGEACNSDEWVTIPISAYDTPNVKAGRNIYPRLMPWDWPEKKKKQWGEDSARYQIRVLGQFPEREEEKLIPYSLAKQVFERKYNRCTDETLVIGLDPAGLGKDKTVWVLRQGSSIVTIKWVLNATDEAIGRRTLELAETYKSANKPTIINIDGGWGKGIYEYLRKHGNPEKVKINLVFLSSKPENDENEYYNLRTQVGFRLKEAIERGLCLSPSARIVKDAWLSDITAIKVIEDPRTGKRKLENKRKLKKRLKRSPDFLDATLLSFVSSYRTPPAMVTVSEFQYKEANKEVIDNSMFPSMMHQFKIKRRNPIFFFRNNIRRFS